MRCWNGGAGDVVQAVGAWFGAARGDELLVCMGRTESVLDTRRIVATAALVLGDRDQRERRRYG